MTRTSLDAGTARRTLVVIYLGQTGLGVHADGIELAGTDTVATTQTAEAAARLTGTTGIDGSTGLQAVIPCNALTQLARSVTPYYGHHRFRVGNGHAQQVGHFAHYLTTADGTLQPVETAGVGTLDERIGQTATTGKAATTTVGTGQRLGDLCDARVLKDGKFLGADIQHEGGYQTDASQYCYCNQNEIHNLFVYCFIVYCSIQNASRFCSRPRVNQSTA